ncbi:MAG: serine hydroxymethyltransferase [Candidatus Hadarchaeales archaeon]|nr:MAG: serine hydroxymethyltransferase [Hadesarchaea archaeon]
MKPREAFERTFELLRLHHQWMKETINLIASENVTSLAVREALLTDFQHRYAEGWPGERVYAGCKYIDQVELLGIELAKELFEAEHANVQPTSGVAANLAMYTALTDPGDRMMSLAIPAGGHISMGKKKLGGTAGAVHGLEVEYWPFDEKKMNIDVEEGLKKVREIKPKLLLFGGSVLLFPHPVKEFREVAEEIGAYIGYDAAHVAGLIAGKQFQNPLKEGADVMTCSTHKTLPGPQHGMILCRKELAEAVNRAVFPGVVSNHHLHCVAALNVALAEMLEFGREYAAQIVKNARRLAEELYEGGLRVVGADLGFTSSHIVLVEVVREGGGRKVEERLERANILVNRNLLPWDIREGRHYKDPGGIRLGVSEVTRLGMKEEEMGRIAEFILRVVRGENPEKVAQDVREFRRGFTRVHYAFDSMDEAYEYIRLR